jgi:hypothetical protein
VSDAVSSGFIKNPVSDDNSDERFNTFFHGRKNAAQSNPQMRALSSGVGGENLQWPTGAGNYVA